MQLLSPETPLPDHIQEKIREKLARLQIVYHLAAAWGQAHQEKNVPQIVKTESQLLGACQEAVSMEIEIQRAIRTFRAEIAKGQHVVIARLAGGNGGLRND